MKLNIGAGKKTKRGYTTVDIQPPAEIVAPAWDIPLDSAEAIYSRHMIEHLTRAQATAALREWRRLLVPNGTLEIICPNREYHVWQLSQPGMSPFGPWTNLQHAMAGLYGWQHDDHDIHQWAWTADELCKALTGAGFHHVRSVPTRACDIEVLANG